MVIVSLTSRHIAFARFDFRITSIMHPIYSDDLELLEDWQLHF
jgi:hypothetical protein